MEKVIFKVKTKDFVKTLGIGGAMAGKNKTIPLLDAIKLEIGNDSLFVTSFNGEVGVSSVCDIIVDGDSSTCACFLAMSGDIVPYVRAIKDEDLTIEIMEKSYKVCHSKGDATFSYLDANDFPAIPAIGGDMGNEEFSVSISADGKTLGGILSQASLFVSTDQLRPVMGGVLFNIEKGRMTLAASDSHKLYINSFDVKYDGGKRDVVVPLPAVSMMCAILNEGDNAIITIGEKYISLTCGKSSVSSSLIIGKYPNVAAVVPTTFEQSMGVYTSEFSEVITRLLIISNKATNAIRIAVDGINEVNVSAEDLGLNKSASESLSATNVQGDVTFGVKGSLLLQCLKVIDTDYAHFGMNGNRKAITIKEVDGNDNKIVIIMPLAI